MTCRKTPAPTSPERIGSIRNNIFMDDKKEWLIERVNAGMGEWEYVISYLGEYFATAPSELIAREIQEAYSDRATIRNQTLDEIIKFRKVNSKELKIHDMWVAEAQYLESLRTRGHERGDRR